MTNAYNIYKNDSNMTPSQTPIYIYLISMYVEVTLLKFQFIKTKKMHIKT